MTHHRCSGPGRHHPHARGREWERDRESSASGEARGSHPHEDGDRWEGRRARREDRRWRRRERKERVLHTRVSQKLSDDIRRLAEDMRVPVSNLVRNVLEEAFSVVEEMSDDVGEILDDVINEAETATERFRRFQANRRARARAEAELAETERRGPRPYAQDEPAEEARIREEEVEREPAAARDAAPAEPTTEGEPPRAEGAGDAEDEPAPRPATGAFARVVAWQPVILNAPQRCARTGRQLRPGSEAYMGITAQGLGGIYLSREGLDELHQ